MNKSFFTFLLLVSVMLVYAKSTDSTKAINHVLKGKELYNNQSYNGALVELDSALLFIKKLPEAFYYKGLCFHRIGNLKSAIKNYSSAISLNDKYLNAYEHRALAYHELAQFKKSIIDYSIAIELNPTDACLFSNRGATKMAAKDYIGAIDDFQKALNLDPDFKSVYYLKAEAEYYDEKLEDAYDDFLSYLLWDPKSSYACLYLGDICVEFDELDDAIRYLDLCLRLDPENDEALFLRGYCKFNAEVDDLGYSDCQKSMNLGNKDAKKMMKVCF